MGHIRRENYIRPGHLYYPLVGVLILFQEITWYSTSFPSISTHPDWINKLGNFFCSSSSFVKRRPEILCLTVQHSPPPVLCSWTPTWDVWLFRNWFLAVLLPWSRYITVPLCKTVFGYSTFFCDSESTLPSVSIVELKS